eukprot:jgi/Hompol1/5733/HPOL_004678-RA
MVQGGRKRIHTTFPPTPTITPTSRIPKHQQSCERECIEEYDAKTDDLLLRKWRYKSSLGAWSQWDIEIGEPPRTVVNSGSGPAATNPRDFGGSGSMGGDIIMSESASNPYMVRRDTRSHFVWRIRNLPWPKDTYQVSIDAAEYKIVVRTSNKKQVYFARFSIPDMDRADLPLESSSLAIDWGSNTLVVMYKKPAEILDREQQDRLERQAIKTSGPVTDGQKEGDMQCNPQ